LIFSKRFLAPIQPRLRLRFIRLRQNTPQLAAGMNGGANRVEARQGEDGLASAQFRFDTPQLAAGSFITTRLDLCSLLPHTIQSSVGRKD